MDKGINKRTWEENVQIALEIVKQTQDQIGRFSLEGFEKLCFMEIVEEIMRGVQ